MCVSVGMASSYAVLSKFFKFVSFVSKSMAIQVAFDENLLYEFDDCKCCEACLAQWKDSYCTGECH